MKPTGIRPRHLPHSVFYLRDIAECMLIDFNEIPEVTLPGMNKGTGEMSSRMFVMD